MRSYNKIAIIIPDVVKTMKHQLCYAVTHNKILKIRLSEMHQPWQWHCASPIQPITPPLPHTLSWQHFSARIQLSKFFLYPVGIHESTGKYAFLTPNFLNKVLWRDCWCILFVRFLSFLYTIAHRVFSTIYRELPGFINQLNSNTLRFISTRRHFVALTMLICYPHSIIQMVLLLSPRYSLGGHN